jgi:radical SAM family uncharacterized protein/radical SAM-linked protein
MFEKIEKDLEKFQKPGRYTGIELGIPEKDFKNSDVRFLISYPDVYDIGMSNLGIKIIYDRINAMDFASCERVFSPWIDLEEYLRKNSYPLFSLESKSPLYEFDFIGISIQYELLFSNFLNILDLGKMELFSEKRKDDSPIVICGGPGIVNPAPYKPFVDLFLIGEAEDTIRILLEKYRTLKEQKKSRNVIIKELSDIEGIYSPAFSGNKKIKRQIYAGFHLDEGIQTQLIPLVDIVQNKLVVEIMRGCPNKCRFCQAGIIYKPYREKNVDLIMKNIENGLNKLGINEVTLSSLSSGDYSQIIDLTERFAAIYKDRHISFSLPSIKVESFDIDLLDKISIVRKSGLTFAIESGSIAGQSSINKIVLIDKIKAIIDYGVTKGWKLIKLYFMIGLPHVDDEKEAIISFISDLLRLSKKIKMNINLAVFVPKSHTPYQNERQLGLDESIDIIKSIQTQFKQSRAKIKNHNPYMSFLEGIISRGDESVGLAVYEAFKSGARFDGWDDMFNFQTYIDAFAKTGLDTGKFLNSKNADEPNFWSNIDAGPDEDFYRIENEKSRKKELTGGCKEECQDYCKICNANIKKINAVKNDTEIISSVFRGDVKERKEETEKKTRVFLEFSKLNLSRFIGHIDIIRYFEKLFNLSKIDIAYTEGFNPHPKVQFSSPLPLGIESVCEVIELKTKKLYEDGTLLNLLKKFEHPEIPINRVKNIFSTEKKSIINNVHLTNYCAIFDKIYYNELYDIADKYKNSKIKYSLVKNNNKIEGYYQDFFSICNVTDESVYFDIKKIDHMPKFLDTINFIIGNIPLKIRKLKMLTSIDGKLTDLFDLYDDRQENGLIL